MENNGANSSNSSVPERNVDLERSIQQLVFTARDQLNLNLDIHFRLNFNGEETREQKVLSKVFKQLEAEYQQVRYGYLYDDNFKKQFHPYCVEGVMVKRDPSTFRRKKESIEYSEIEKNSSDKFSLFYLHFPLWKSQKSELLFFKSPRLLLAYSLAHDYYPKVSKDFTIPGYGSVTVTQTSTMLQQTYMDEDRKRSYSDKSDNSDEKASSRPYMRAYIDVAPDLLFDQEGKKLCMKRLDSNFFSFPWLNYINVVPAVKQDDQYDPLSLFPYFLFLFTIHLRHEKAVSLQLVNELLPMDDKGDYNYEKCKKLFDTIDFDAAELDFFCFLLQEIRNIVETEKWIRTYGTVDDAKREYDSAIICNFNWNEWVEPDLSKRKEVMEVIFRIDPYANLNALLYETKDNPKMTKHLKNRFCAVDNTPADMPTSRMLKLDYFSEDGYQLPTWI